MGNVQMEADQIRYKDSSGTYRNVQTGLAAAIAGGGGGSSTLAGLTDTDISSPTNGQVLAYDSSESKWVNAASASGATTLEGLTDTAITTPSDGQVLTYDSTAEKWENAAIPAQSIDGLSDTTITTPSDGQVLTYDATAEKWENATPASGVTTLVALTDTAITTPSDGQVLTYDATAEKWINSSGGSGGGGEVYPAVGTEAKIGTWAGYDLYRQVFQAISAASSTNVTMGTLPFEYYPVTIQGYYRTSGGTLTALPVYGYVSNAFKSTYATAVKNATDNIINVAVSNNQLGSSIEYTVIVDYLKSTPTP